MAGGSAIFYAASRHVSPLLVSKWDRISLNIAVYLFKTQLLRVDVCPLSCSIGPLHVLRALQIYISLHFDPTPKTFKSNLSQ